MQILPHVYTHLKEFPKSMLARIYGIFTVSMKGYRPVNLILMCNTLRLKKPEDLFRIYDLKGSRVGREVDTKGSKPSTTLKDINFFKNSAN